MKANFSANEPVHKPANEKARLETLHAYQILDTLPQQAYDDISQLASQICGTPIALVSLVDDERQWFKARVGLETQQLPRATAFCAHAILQPEQLFIVPDATCDARFVDNPLVTDDPHIRFYAGAPLLAPDGEALGTLCVIDREPRQLSDEQQNSLSALARQVMAQIQLQKFFNELAETMHERRKIESALRQSQQRFEMFMNNSPALAFIKSATGHYEYVNQPFLRRFELEECEVLGHTDDDLWPVAAEELRAHDQSVLEGHETVELTESVTEENGETSYWLSFKFPLQNNGKRFLAGMGLDITQSKRYEQQLEEYQTKLETLVAHLEIQSRSDGLTGLLNRRAFDQKLAEEWERARRYDQPLSLLMMDVDRFKAFNDSFGHLAGDETLQSVARALQDKARNTDAVARYGGEEFVAILPNTDSRGAQIMAERFRQVIETTAWPHRAVTISIGVASLQTATANCDQLVDSADQALYRAKAHGRNRVECAV